MLNVLFRNDIHWANDFESKDEVTSIMTTCLCTESAACEHCGQIINGPLKMATFLRQ